MATARYRPPGLQAFRWHGSLPRCRRRLLLRLAALALPGVLEAAHAAEAPGQRPNFVVFLADDQGWSGTSVRMDPAIPGSKSDYYETPALERLAREGMVFASAYAPAPNCSPARASLLTGMSPARLHMTDLIDRQGGPPGLHALVPPDSVDALPAEATTLAEALKALDPRYATAHLGKWHLAGGGPAAHGFDTDDGDTGNRDGNRVGPGNPKAIVGLSLRARAFIERQVAAGRPFYLQISHYALHGPPAAQEGTLRRYQNRLPGARHRHPLYAAMTLDLDASLGFVLETLAELRIADRTYVIYTSDNGGSTEAGMTTNAPLAGGKAALAEGGIRVPLVIRGPRVEPGSACAVPVIGWDLHPTVLDLAGAGVGAFRRDGIDGGSLRPLLEGGGRGANARPRDGLTWHFPHYQDRIGTTPQSAIRIGRYKLLRFYEEDTVALFDVVADPGEQRDLAAEQPERAAALRRQLEEHLEAAGAALPRIAPPPEPARKLPAGRPPAEA